MKKFVMLLLVMCVMVLHAIPADATLQNNTMGPMGDPPLSLDGTWVVLDEYMDVGDFFTGAYTWTSATPILFTITDLFVVTDIFEIYNFGSLVATTPTLSDWDDLGETDPFGSTWENDPDAALASGNFSSASILFGPGSYSITIRDIHIPPTVTGWPFGDGTVAFKAEGVPEPATILFLGSGMLGLVIARRKLRN